MTRPVWDGDGRDPWLPSRLDAKINAGAAERLIRRAFWSALSGWLVETGRRVLRGQRPDLEVIWARAPAWADAVDQVVRGAIRPAMGSAYARLLGEGFPWDQRPFASSYLAEVRNRLVRVPDEVYDLVAGQVAQGVNLGEGISEIADRVDDVLSTTDSERWPNRATVVARTEAIGALNAGRYDAFRAVAEETGDEFEKVWLATIDNRTRPSHRAADGQRVPVGEPFEVGGFKLEFPGDPNGPPQEVIQCVPWQTRVQYPSVRAIFRRWYEGEMITIHLAGGDHLTITPNHPVLRGDGAWVPAHLLQEGDHCVRATPIGQSAGQPDEDRRPPEIGDVHHAASLTAVTQRIPLTPPDLHGDRPNGNVEVVPVYGDLAFNGQPASDQEVYQFGLTLADKARTTSRAVNRGLDTVRSPGLTFKLDPGTSGRVSGGSQLTALLDRQVGHPEAVGLAGISDRQAQGGQAPLDDWAANVQISGHLQDTVPLFVTLAKIVKVERYAFHGHVFNLDTGAGWYIANGITIKNCRCTMLLVEPGETTDMSNRQFLGGA